MTTQQSEIEQIRALMSKHKEAPKEVKDLYRELDEIYQTKPWGKVGLEIKRTKLAKNRTAIRDAWRKDLVKWSKNTAKKWFKELEKGKTSPENVEEVVLELIDIIGKV